MTDAEWKAERRRLGLRDQAAAVPPRPAKLEAPAEAPRAEEVRAAGAGNTSSTETPPPPAKPSGKSAMTMTDAEWKAALRSLGIRDR